MKKLFGFTLIEIIISIALIGIVVAFALPITENYISKSKDSKALSNIRLLERLQKAEMPLTHTPLTSTKINEIIFSTSNLASFLATKVSGDYVNISVPVGKCNNETVLKIIYSENTGIFYLVEDGVATDKSLWSEKTNFPLISGNNIYPEDISIKGNDGIIFWNDNLPPGGESIQTESISPKLEIDRNSLEVHHGKLEFHFHINGTTNLAHIKKIRIENYGEEPFNPREITEFPYLINSPIEAIDVDTNPTTPGIFGYFKIKEGEDSKTYKVKIIVNNDEAGAKISDPYIYGNIIDTVTLKLSDHDDSKLELHFHINTKQDFSELFRIRVENDGKEYFPPKEESDFPHAGNEAEGWSHEIISDNDNGGVKGYFLIEKRSSQTGISKTYKVKMTVNDIFDKSSNEYNFHY